MRKSFIFLTCVLLSTLVFSQDKNGKISGIITDEVQKPLQSASVSLLRAKDSALVKIAVTDKEGRYEFDKLVEGNYLLSVTSIGFQKRVGQSLEITAVN